MYKDVWKRILAAVLSICLVVVLIQLPDFTVQAEEGKTYYEYRHSGNGISSTVSSKRAAAVFQSGQSQGDEYIEATLFDVFVSEGTDLSGIKASISLYLNPNENVPDSGTFICSSELYELTEGTNSLTINLEDAKVSVGETFSIIVSLEGEGVSFYADEGKEAGKTFAANEDGSWLDLVTAGQCANITAKTSKIEPEKEENDIIAAAAALFSDIKETMASESTEEKPQEIEVQETETIQPQETEASEESLISPANTEQTTEKDVDNGLGGLVRASNTVLPNKDIQVPVGTTHTVQLNNPVDAEVYTWTSDDDSIASVTAGIHGEAVITANAVGTTNIKVTDAAGLFSDSCKITVAKNLGADTVTITVKDADISYDGTAKTPEIEVMDGADILEENTHYTKAYSSDNTDAGSGKKIIISGINTYRGNKEQTFTIGPKNVMGLEIQWESAYAGGIFPWTENQADVSTGLIAWDAQRSEKLVYGTDYELIYPSDEDHTTEGVHTVIVRGLDQNYTGDKSVSYTVQADINNDLEIRMKNGTPFETEYTYTGYEVKPQIEVLYKGTVLNDKTDYTISYSANCTDVTAPGVDASLTVLAQGSYTGTKTFDYKIIPKDISEYDNTISAVVITPDELVAGRGNDAVTPVLPPFEAAYNGKDMLLNTDYVVDTASYQFLSGTDWSDATLVSVKLKGTGNYTGERTLKYSIGSDLKSELGSINAIADQMYTGSEIKPSITFANASSLQEGTDFDIYMSANINAGTATVKVMGKNGHGGELTQTFKILPKDLGTLDPSCFSYRTPVEYVPETAGIVTELLITYNGKELKEGEAYIAVFSNNLSATTANSMAEITLNPGANGNFIGTKTLKYEISRCNIKDNANINITGIDKSYSYTGSSIKPEPTVTYVGAANPLIKNTDYELIYSADTTGQGQPSVTIKGKGNYTGSVVIKYEIAGIPIENVILDYQPDSTDVTGYSGVYLALKKHTGNEIRLDSNIVLYKDKTDQANNKPLTQDTDYKLSYVNHKDISTSAKMATVKLEGMGNYSGDKTFSFLIAKELSTLSIPAISPQTYTGESIRINDLGITDGWFNALEEDLDYKVAYEDNENNGTATITVKGTEVPTVNGCYTGSIVRTFMIKPRKLGDTAVSVQIKDQQFKGVPVEIPTGKEDEEINAVLTNPDTGNQKMLEFQADYTILAGSYTENTAKGTASVVLEGSGNFEGQRQVDFEIIGKSIADSSIKVTIQQGTGTSGAWLYDRGTAITPRVTLVDVTANNYELVPNQDYQIKYDSNINAGTADIILTGQGNYSNSTRTEHFMIERLSIQNAAEYTVTGFQPSYSYTGFAIEPVPIVSYKVGGTTTKLETKDYSVSWKYNENATTSGQQAEITVRGEGNYKDTQTVIFSIARKDIGANDVVIADIPPQVSTGTKVTPTLDIKYGEYTLQSVDFTPEYSDNIMNGTASVEVTGQGNFTGTANTTFEIRTPLDDTAFDITYLGESFYTYTGSEIKPAVIVKSKTTGKELTNGVDYEVIYDNNINAGTSAYPASVSVNGIGNYAGKKIFEFLIMKKNIADSDVAAALVRNSYEFTGLQIKPEVDHVTYNGKPLLTGSAGNDYTVAYGANQNAGSSAGTVVIDAANSKNYEGTKTLLFDITAKNIGAGTTFATGFSMEDIPVQGVSGAAVCPVPVVKYRISSTDTRTLSFPDDFTVSYRQNTGPGTAYVTISACGNYSGSVTKTFQIGYNIAEAVVDGIGDSYHYAGTPIEPKPTSVTVNGTTLTEGPDYTVDWDRNDDVGEASVIITGKGAYGGSITKSFKIFGNIRDAVVVAMDDVPFTGSPVYPLPDVTWKGRSLIKGSEYELSYRGNQDIGTATITITGKGYFRLDTSQEVTFEIVNTTDIFVLSHIDDQIYCGEDIQPEVSVSYGGTKLVKDKDYKLIFSRNKNAGTAYVTVQGINGYVSVPNVTKTFAIDPLNVENMVLQDALDTGNTNSIVDREYTGETITPKFTLSYQEGGKTIYTLKETDYSLSFGQNKEIGPATVTINGVGTNCTGTRIVDFSVIKRNINNVTFAEILDQTYTGSEIEPEVKLSNGAIPLEETDFEKIYEFNKNAGLAVIHLKGIGTNYTGERDVNFEITKLNFETATNVFIKEIVGPYYYTGGEIEPVEDVVVAFNDADGVEHVLDPETDYEVSFSENVNRGNAAVATVKGQGTNFTGRKSTTFTIAARNIGSDEIVIEKIPNQAYTGADIFVPVTIKLGEYTLDSDKDYELFHESNKEIGTATVKIVGKGNFTGNNETTFVIANSIDNALIVEGLNSNYTYTGNPIEPKNLTVQIGDTTLEEETDYTIAYDKNTDAGEASLILWGVGTYGGPKTFKFNIDRKKITDSDIVMTGFAEEVPYTEGAVTQNVVLTYGEVTLEEGNDYEIRYYKNTGVGLATMEIVGLDQNYEGKITKDFTIGKKSIKDSNIQVTNISSIYTYTGTPIEPVPVVKQDGEETPLVRGEHYEVSYEKNLDAGIATIVLTGIGSYGDERKIDFDIVRKSIMLCSFSGVTDQVYTGSDVKPGVTVADAEEKLTEGIDYTLMYQYNRMAGTGLVIVAGKNNYTVTKNIKFQIIPGGINAVAVSSSSSSSIGLSWSAEGVATGYEIYRAETDNRFTRVARTRNMNYNDEKLTGGTTYKYKVRAYLVMDGETYYSAFSDIVTGSTN